jgi:hypothetical protein
MPITVPVAVVMAMPVSVMSAVPMTVMTVMVAVVPPVGGRHPGRGQCHRDYNRKRK